MSPLISLPYVQALHRIEQLLIGALMTDIAERAVQWRQDARCIADEWCLTQEMRDRLMSEAAETAFAGVE